MSGMYQRALADVSSAVRRPRIWVLLGLRSVRYSYKRTVLGPWWDAIDQIVFTVGFGYMSAWLFGGDIQSRLTYVGLGLLSFSLVSQLISTGAQSFVSSTSLRYAQVPIAARVFKQQLQTLIVFLHRLAPMIVLLIVLGQFPGLRLFESLAGLALVIVWGVSLSFVLGPICARFRDIQPMINLVLRLALFASPVFWRPDSGANSAALQRLSDVNPIAVLMELIRSPLLGEDPRLRSVLVATTMIAVLVVLGFVTFARSYARIQSWV